MPPKGALPNVRPSIINTTPPLICSNLSNLPVWDDAQIAQENWGCPLAATASTGSVFDAGQEGGRQASAKQKSTGGQAAPSGHPAAPTTGPEGNFEDAVGHQCVTDFIQACRTPKGKAATTEEGTAVVPPTDDEVTWKRPVDIFRPFRPVVHRNATPFVNPYASEDALTPMEAKVDEEVHPPRSSLGGAASSGGPVNPKKSIAGLSRNAEGAATAVPETFHQQYPEAVTVLEDFVGDDVTRWSHCSRIEAVRRYRALPVLMQPYDGALVAGCAETPAEACGSRYSTALRHKLKQAEQLSALAEAPPFLMASLDSALLAVEQAQRYIPAGSYLWELVYPHAPGTCHPVYNPFGKYAVKLFVAGAYRKVVVDDRLPVDVLGRPLLTTTSLKELWPALLGKAIVKALGPVTGVEALVASPDLIVSALLGKWVPQYLSPRRAPVTTMAALHLYERHLKKLSAVHAPVLQDTLPLPKKSIIATDDADDANKKEMTSVASGKGSGIHAPRRRSSSQRKRTASFVKKESSTVDDTPADQQSLFASEYCPATIDEPIPEQSMYVCGLRAVPAQRGAADARAPTGAATATPVYQLLTIHAIKHFRNTFALLLHTTPRLQLTGGVFEKEKDADDVSALQRWGSHHYHPAKETSKARVTSFIGGDCASDLQSAQTTEMVVVDNVRKPSVMSCWLTVEEFMAQVDQVVVWRVLEGMYAHVKSVTGKAVLQYNGIVGSGDSAAAAHSSNAGAAASSAKQAAGSGGQKGVSPSREEAQTAIKKSKQEAQAPDALYPKTLAPTCLWWKLTAETAVEAVVVMSCPTLTEARLLTPSSSGAASSAADNYDVSVLSSLDIAAAHERRVDFHHFQWERAEPLNHVGSVTYTDGALRSTVLWLRPGTHLLRVDLHNLRALDTIAFLSDAAIEVQLDLTYDFNQDGFATVTDAGTFPAMVLPDINYIWLKRVFTLTKPTCLTVVLSKLDSTEDLAAHRRVNTSTYRTPATAAAAASAFLGGKGAHGKGGSPANARGGAVTTSNTANLASRKKNGSTVVPESSKEQTQPSLVPTGALECRPELQGVPILRFTTMLLVSLDNPKEFYVGSAGQLVQLRLEPNDKGYLIVAYTSVPAALLSDNMLCGPRLLVEEVTEMPHLMLTPGASPGIASTEIVLQSGSPNRTEATTSPIAPLFAAGQWKLTLRSDVELQAFESVVHNIHNVQVEAYLSRSGSPVLFRRVCTVVEPTHLSVFAQLRTPLPMAYTVRITRPGTAPAAAATELPLFTTTGPLSRNVAGAFCSSPLAASDSNFLTEASAANASIVFESEATEGRLFVADIFLPCTQEGSCKATKATGVATGGGGNAAGPTTYIIEAFVSQASATAWNDECRRRKEEIFVQLRENAEARAAALQQNDLTEIQDDPDGFVQRRKEVALLRRQQLAESAERVVTHVLADAPPPATDVRGTRSRSSSCGRRQSHHVSAPLDALAKGFAHQQTTSLTDETVCEAATPALLDATDPASLVHLSAQLSFSSTRAELKGEPPAPDPVAELRQHMRETMMWLQERIVDNTAPARIGSCAPSFSAGPGGPSAAPSSSAGNPKLQASRNQKDNAAAALSVEDALRAKLARQSRLAYLRNPKHLFLPSSEVAEAGHGEASTPSATSAAVGTPASAPLNSTKSKQQQQQQQHEGCAGGGHVTSPSAAAPLRSGSKEPIVSSGSAVRLLNATPGELAGSQASHRGPEMALQDGAATRFRYVAPLTPSEYKVEYLPLLSYEESTSISGGRERDAGGGGAGGGSGAAIGKRPKASSGAAGMAAGSTKGATGAAAMTASSNSAATNSVAAGGAGGAGGSAGGVVSIVGSSTLLYPLTTVECEALISPLQALMVDAAKVWEPAAAATTRPVKAENRAKFRASYQAYFEAMAAQKTAAGAHGGGDGCDTAVRPVVYHSVLGIREDEMAVSVKAKKSTTAA
ncbi:putative calpain-like cysteine peptidase putative cysteine peptidase Clan CA family C2 [Leptomonas seymouri]|uniref:Putative calpain-like cysteine peptidase putative cysteine peptidase Clan CA family C2 n=1 Tax=Leptomonas seymouri TaxID=5684 RepID=A0A0N0P9A0_LEPSE|nr:putative calpain-like cysteine peptidase putative cysteine peptidase Clan CA family C2 [Leptomonas seymouri]|eukprot:KPI90869.1 putative calpain-like cysteine peptidase putative cysteine peptidase Clan CA family C2 [Leptomonas seymouri]